MLEKRRDLRRLRSVPSITSWVLELAQSSTRLPISGEGSAKPSKRRIVRGYASSHQRTALTSSLESPSKRYTSHPSMSARFAAANSAVVLPENGPPVMQYTSCTRRELV